jgi:hypothetical protein
MQKRSIDWLREAITNKTTDKVTIVGGAVGAFLINQGQPDLIYSSGGLTGDGSRADDDQFTFCSYSLQRMIYPLAALEPLYCCYACPYSAIESVYEGVSGRPVVLLKDPVPPDASDGQRNGFTTERYR